MKTKVAVVLPYFGRGGAENMVAHLVSHLDLDQVNVQVFCIFGKPQQNHLEEEVRSHGVNITYIGKGLGFSPSAAIKLYKALNKFEPDVIHTHLSGGFYAGFWVLFHNIKMLHTVHNMPLFEAGKIKRNMYAMLYKLNKAVPVAISNEIRNQVEEIYHMPGRVELVYNPVDVERFSTIGKKVHSGFIFLSAGRLSEQKNQKLLIDAFYELLKDKNHVKLIILGDGPNKECLNQQVKRLRLENDVFLPGNVVNIEEYMARADVFILSSLYEGLPLVLLEAMAARLPIISTDVGGVKDIVTDNGILVPPMDVKKLKSAMQKIMEEESLREKFAAKSYEHVLKYNSPNIANQYTELYKKYGSMNRK